MSSPTLSDDLAARLRAAFADRAEQVRPEQLDPELPHGVRISLDDGSAAGGRGPGGRVAWLSLAAAVLVVVAALGLGAAVRDDGETTTAGDPETPATTAPRAEVFSSFPKGVDAASGDPIFVSSVQVCPGCTEEAAPDDVDDVADPEALVNPAAEAAMAEALAPLDEVTEPMPTDLDLPGETWESFYAPLTDADPDVWGAAADPNERGGVVVARPAPADGWGVVAVTSQVIDMSGLVRQGDVLAGEVRVSVPAPVRLVVAPARSDGASPTSGDVTTAELTTGDVVEEGITESVLDLGDPASPGGMGVPVGDGPIVVRVEVGDGSGQVGVDGVGVAAMAAVGIPAGAGSASGVGSETATTAVPETATTTVPGPATSTVPVRAGGFTQDDVMWQPADDADAEVEDDPAEVAALFVGEVLGEAPASVDRPGAGSGQPPSTEPPASDVPGVIVVVPLVSGADLRVIVAVVDDRWSVVQVGDGGVRATTEGGATSVSGGPPGGSGDDSHLWIALRREGDGWSVERGRLPDEPVSFEGADAAVIAVVDDLDQIVAADGNAL